MQVDGEITPDFLAKMEAGIYLPELGLKTRKCKLRQTGKDTFHIILTQGVNRQIRRTCAACGRRVRKLKRIRVMSVTLGSLKPGEYVELPAEEVAALYQGCGIGLKKITGNG